MKAKTTVNARLQDQAAYDNQFIPKGEEVEITSNILSDGSDVVLYKGYHHVLNACDLEEVVEYDN